MILIGSPIFIQMLRATQYEQNSQHEHWTAGEKRRTQKPEQKCERWKHIAFTLQSIAEQVHRKTETNEVIWPREERILREKKYVDEMKRREVGETHGKMDVFRNIQQMAFCWTSLTETITIILFVLASCIDDSFSFASLIIICAFEMS